MEVVVGVLIFSLSLLIFAIAYKKLLAYLGKGSLPKEKYCVLYSLEVEPASGEVKFYFTSEVKREVKFQIFDQKYNFIKEIYNQECKADGNIIPFDTTTLENGIYYYAIVTENQKTMKKMTIAN
ncbi:MAG TPA: T9SS type A sorting domain-containing protein [Taishania sp.]|nr:T9SS type A sorting domain-containing protein [Taishania sp.]